MTSLPRPKPSNLLPIPRPTSTEPNRTRWSSSTGSCCAALLSGHHARREPLARSSPLAPPPRRRERLVFGGAFGLCLRIENGCQRDRHATATGRRSGDGRSGERLEPAHEEPTGPGCLTGNRSNACRTVHGKGCFTHVAVASHEVEDHESLLQDDLSKSRWIVVSHWHFQTVCSAGIPRDAKIHHVWSSGD